MSKQELKERKQDVTEKSEEKRKVCLPLVDIYNQDGSAVLLIDMPGILAESLDIEVKDSILFVRGKTSPQNISGSEKWFSEYEESDYERAFAIAENINQDEIEATLKNGTLKLVLPQLQSKPGRRIKLKAV